MEDKNKLCLMVGRFGHFHSGHFDTAMEALKQSEKLLILVGSSQEIEPTIRNPFHPAIRIRLIQEVFKDFDNVYVGFLPDMTHEDDINFEWGKWVLDHVVLWRAVFNLPFMDSMVYGNDENRMGWFNPEDVRWIKNIIIDRAINPISATRMRELIAKNDFWEWSKYAPMPIRNQFTRLREELLEVPYYKEMSENV